MIGFGFLNPWLIPFAALIAVPVIIYLWNRQRYTVMPWAAMAFVARAVARNRRRLKVENLLLLLIRMLIVLLIVAAFTRPVIEDAGALADLGEGRRNIVFMIDQSFSMGLRQGAGTVFERAREAATGLADTLLRDGDRFGIVLLGAEPATPDTAASSNYFLYESPVLLDQTTKRRVLNDLSELKPRAVPGDGARAFAALADYLTRFEGAGTREPEAPTLGLPKQVFVLTDMQRSTFVKDGALKNPSLVRIVKQIEDRNAEVTIVDCGAETTPNVAVTAFAADAEVVAAGTSVLLTASVRSYADRTLEDLTLELRTDGVQVRDVALSLEPGEERQLELYAVFDTPGSHTAEVVLRTDGLVLDNARYLSLDVRDALHVALVDGEPRSGFGEGETDFLVTAVAPGGDDQIGVPDLMKPQLLTSAELADLDLDSVHVLVLANVIALSKPEVEQIEAFVRRGGGLLLFLGPQVDASVWNELLYKDGAGLLPARLGEVVLAPEPDERYYRLKAENFRHPALQPFALRETTELLRLPRFWGYVQVELPPDATGDADHLVLARFEERRATVGGEVRNESEDESEAAAPALLERRFGRGRVLLFTSTADGAWSNFFAQFAYLIMWQRAVTYLSGVGSLGRNSTVGEPFETILPSKKYAREILLTIPDEAPVEKVPEMLGERDRFRITHADTRRPGIYELFFRREAQASERGAAFAVNVDTEESDLSRMGEEELKQLLPAFRFQYRNVEDVDRLIGGPERSARGVEIWPYLLWAVLALLVIESMLACSFGRRTKV